MKNFQKGFIAGILVAVIMFGVFGTVSASKGMKTVELQYNDIKVTLDGKEVECADVNGDATEPFIISGTTYLPVRAVANALGLDVNWDPNTKTVVLTSGDENSGQNDSIVGKYRRSYDGSTLTITSNADGSCNAVLSIIRLTYVDDLAGYYANGKLTVTGTDGSGRPLTAEITFPDGQAVLTITDTTWMYFKNADQFIFDKQ